jgi:hypothetical protein
MKLIAVKKGITSFTDTCDFKMHPIITFIITKMSKLFELFINFLEHLYHKCSEISKTTA